MLNQFAEQNHITKSIRNLPLKHFLEMENILGKEQKICKKFYFLPQFSDFWWWGRTPETWKTENISVSSNQEARVFGADIIKAQISSSFQVGFFQQNSYLKKKQPFLTKTKACSSFTDFLFLAGNPPPPLTHTHIFLVWPLSIQLQYRNVTLNSSWSRN